MTFRPHPRAILVAALVLAAGGCGSDPPRLASARLFVDPTLAAMAPAPHCLLGAELRPGPGCLAPKLVASFPDASAAAAKELPIPAGFERRRLVVTADVDGPERHSDRIVVGRTVLPEFAAQPVVRVDELARELPHGRGLRVWARPVPHLRHVMPPVTVRSGAVLAFGIGIDPFYVGPGVDKVIFTVSGRTARGTTHGLFEATLDVDDAPHAWQDHRVPLDAIAGEETSLTLMARVVPRPDVPPDVRAGLPKVSAGPLTVVPLWGAPEILEPVAEDDDRPNVLVVSLDTLRADFLGVYGSAFPTSPRLDALAAEGVRFERPLAVYPSTTASHMSMLTGLYPARHGVRGPLNPLAPEVPTLAGILSAHGWRTSAVTEDAMVAISVGFTRGFGFYRENRAIFDEHRMRAPEHTIGYALEWLERHARERFFLFVHTYCVHMPYEPPPEHDRFTTWRDGERERPIAEAPFIERLRHAYAGSVRYADAQVGRLLDALDRLGIAERTIVIVTADHGDEFGEHGGTNHNRTVYQEVLHVPMLFRAPGRLPAGRRVGTPVSLVDLSPTILDLVGVPIPSGWDGESQLARMRGAPDDLERVVFAEAHLPAQPGQHLIAARTATAKWIYAIGTDRIEAYDLTRDPTEQRHVDDAAFLERGRAAVAPYRERMSRGAPASAPGEAHVDEGTKRNLRALGYID